LFKLSFYSHWNGAHHQTSSSLERSTSSDKFVTRTEHIIRQVRKRFSLCFSFYICM